MLLAGQDIVVDSFGRRKMSAGLENSLSFQLDLHHRRKVLPGAHTLKF